MVRILHAEGDRLPARIRRVDPSAPQAEAACRAIIAAVERDGDAALIEFPRRFDKLDLAARGLRVTPQEFDEAERAVSPQVREALAHAIRNIRRLHEHQMPPPLTTVEVEPGVWCGDRVSPIESVCLYVPRGRG